MRRFLQRIGILRTPNVQERAYEFRVFLMSEGTATGDPRPLEVKRVKKVYSIDFGERFHYSFDYLVERDINHIIRHGLETNMPNGLPVRYAPHTIYKITHEVLSEDA